MRTPSEAPSAVVGVRLSLQQALTLQQIAQANDRPVSTMAKTLLNDALERSARTGIPA